MDYIETELFEFNKIDAEKKLFESVDHIYGENNREKNFEKFISLCKMSAFQGEMRAQYILGMFYEIGIEGLENYFEIDIQAEDKWQNILWVICILRG